MKKEEVVDKIWDESTNGHTANREYMEMLVSDYAKAKCKEQRELCLNEFEPNVKTIGIRAKIWNAPEPNFD